jgi:hypothetical protein
MKYGLTINQLAWSESGLDLDVIDMCVFDILKDYTGCDACEKEVYQGRAWYNVPYEVVINQGPILGLKTTDAVYRRYKKLQSAGILKARKTRNEKVWFYWDENFSLFSFRGKQAKGKPVEFRTTAGRDEEVRQEDRPLQNVDIEKTVESWRSNYRTKEILQREHGLLIDYDDLITRFKEFVLDLGRDYSTPIQLKENFYNWVRKYLKNTSNGKPANGQSVDISAAVERGRQFADIFADRA